MDNKNIIYCKNHIQQQAQITHICLKQNCQLKSILLCNQCIEQHSHGHQSSSQDEQLYNNSYSNYVFPIKLLCQNTNNSKSKLENNISPNNIGEDSSTSDTKTHYESNINNDNIGINSYNNNIEIYEKQISQILSSQCCHNSGDYCLKEIWKENKKLIQIYQLITSYKVNPVPEQQQIEKLETKIKNKLQKISKKCKFINNDASNNINSHGNISSSDQNTETTKIEQNTWNLNNNEMNNNETTLSPTPQPPKHQALNEDEFHIDQFNDENNLDDILEQKSKPTKRIQLENQQYLSHQQNSQPQTSQMNLTGSNGSPLQKKKPRKPRKTKLQKKLEQEQLEQEQQQQNQDSNIIQNSEQTQQQNPPVKRQYNRKQKSKKQLEQTQQQQQQNQTNFLQFEINDINNNNNNINADVSFLNGNTPQQSHTMNQGNYDQFINTSHNQIKEEFNDEDEYMYKYNKQHNNLGLIQSNNQIQSNHQIFSDNHQIHNNNNQEFFNGNNLMFNYEYNQNENDNDFYPTNPGNNNEYVSLLDDGDQHIQNLSNIQNQNNQLYQEEEEEVVDAAINAICNKQFEQKNKNFRNDNNMLNSNRENQINVKTEFEDLIADDYNMQKSPTQYKRQQANSFNTQEFNIKKEEDLDSMKINYGAMNNSNNGLNSRQKHNSLNDEQYDDFGEINYLQDGYQLQNRLNVKEEDDIGFQQYVEENEQKQFLQEEEEGIQQQQMQPSQQQNNLQIQYDIKKGNNNNKNNNEKQQQKQKKQKSKKEQKTLKQQQNQVTNNNQQQLQQSQQQQQQQSQTQQQQTQQITQIKGQSSNNNQNNIVQNELSNNSQNQDNFEEYQDSQIEENVQFEEEEEYGDIQNPQAVQNYDFDITEDIKQEIEKALEQLPKKRQVKRVRNILINSHEEKVHDYMKQNLQKCPQKIPDLIQCVLQYLKQAVSIKKYKKEEFCQLISVIVHQYYITNVENPKVNIQTFAALRNYIKRVALSKLVVPKKSLDVKAKRWTDDEVDKLMQYLKESVTYFEIARRLGRPYSGIVQQINKQRKKQ